jgi:hypothetical protein
MKTVMTVSLALGFCCSSCITKDKWSCDDMKDNMCSPGDFCTDTPTGNCSAGVTLPENESHLSNTLYCCAGGGTFTEGQCCAGSPGIQALRCAVDTTYVQTYGCPAGTTNGGADSPTLTWCICP